MAEEKEIDELVVYLKQKVRTSHGGVAVPDSIELRRHARFQGDTGSPAYSCAASSHVSQHVY